MTYIVNDKCINCRHTDCVEVCPVDCFYIGENTIVIPVSYTHLTLPTIYSV